MQCATIEFARNVVRHRVGANSTEFDDEPPYKVIYKLRDLIGVDALGGTMRLGKYPCDAARKARSRARRTAWSSIEERHRHRYEVNPEYMPALEEPASASPGMSPDGKFVEIVELRGPPVVPRLPVPPRAQVEALRPHPLFRSFIRPRAHEAHRARASTEQPVRSPQRRPGDVRVDAEARAGRTTRRRVRSVEIAPGYADRGRRAAPLLRGALRHRVPRARARDGRRGSRRSREETGARIVYKSSFDKANRSSKRLVPRTRPRGGAATSSRTVKAKTGLPLISDVHEPAQAEAAAEVLDVLQIPAFLCRQTDLVRRGRATGKPVNIKKGQFMAPDDMGHVVEKCRAAGNEKILLCERGASFGYHNLVVDMRVVPDAARARLSRDLRRHALAPASRAAGRETGGLKQYAPVARPRGRGHRVRGRLLSRSPRRPGPGALGSIDAAGCAGIRGSDQGTDGDQQTG